VILHVYVQDDSTWEKASFFYPGETNSSKKQVVYAQSGINSMLIIVPCDSDQLIEYETSGNIDALTIRLVGWIEPVN